MNTRRQHKRSVDRGRSASFAEATSDLVEEFRSRRPLRAGSLLVSVFGDAIAPRGGSVWLGSLIRALESFGVNQRLVRTSVFRLVKDGWLANRQIGRRSYYSLTATGIARIEQASRRIYRDPHQQWTGTWTLVLLSGLAASLRETVRKELGWLGFAPFSASLMAHPDADSDTVDERLRSLPGHDKLLVMRAEVGDGYADYLDELVHDAWSLEELGQRYADFLRRFRPVLGGARRARRIAPEPAFHARTLLIHEYRKIVLRDPLLPAALLPRNWDGLAAYQLCRDLYAAISPAAEEYLSAHMQTEAGPLPSAGAEFLGRFGGPFGAVAL